MFNVGTAKSTTIYAYVADIGVLVMHLWGQ